MIKIKYVGIIDGLMNYEFRVSETSPILTGSINRKTGEIFFRGEDPGGMFSKGAARNVMLKWTKPELNQEAIIAYG
ncbi:MAG: hypothetical protein LBS41_00615 [Streptococcaceae bacterium]|jgi:hypothetical protein|nr:hypothetical protein [Streptococcaceae bacterium]